MNNSVSIGYWGFRGRGQVPRLLLAYTGAVWEDIQYTSPEQWFGGDKQTLGLSFPNLPYLTDEHVKITETDAVIRYIVERSQRKELLGKSPADKAMVNNLMGVINQLFTSIGSLPYDKEYQGKLASTWEKAKPKFEQLSQFRGNKDWLMPYLTVADFLLVEVSYYVEKIYPKEYAQLHFLGAERELFMALNAISKYYEQVQCVKGPFCSPGYAAMKF